MVDLRALSLFVGVAERLNLSQAAKAFHISQSALSRQIQTLERGLDITLFDRAGKRLLLTAEGEDLLPRAQALLDQAYALSERVDAVARGRLGLLRIGATPQTIEALLAHALIDFKQTWTEIETVLVEGSNDFLLSQVEMGAVHVAVAALPDHHDLEGINLFTARVCAVMARAHPLAKRSRIEVNTLREQPLLLLQEGFMTRSLFDSASAKAGLRGHGILESSSMHTLCALAQAGHGIAIVSSTSMPPPECVGIPLTVSGRYLQQTVSAVWNPRRYKSGVVDAFITTLAQHIGTSPHARVFRV